MRSDDDVRQVFEFASDGLTHVEIATRTGVGQSTISKWLRRGESGVLNSAMRKRRSHDGEHCTLIETLPSREYTYLLGQYLGDGSIVTMRNGVERLEITTCDDYPEIRAECMAAVSAVMPGRKVSARRSEGCANVTCYSLHWHCVFPQHGPGRKHERPIVLATWQERVALDRHPDAFIRGLIHSDGSRCINRVRGSSGKRYEYTRYMFSNRSADIRGLFCDACERLSVPWRPDGPYQISVARREGVSILDKVAGPKR